MSHFSSAQVYAVDATDNPRPEAETLPDRVLLKSDKDSLADAVSFVVMRQRGITEAFAFDSHFATAGFVIAPAA